MQTRKPQSFSLLYFASVQTAFIFKVFKRILHYFAFTFALLMLLTVEECSCTSNDGFPVLSHICPFHRYFFYNPFLNIATLIECGDGSGHYRCLHTYHLSYSQIMNS
ncbi:Zinc finger protein BRUTUS [Trichinella pseudospiralis]